MTSLRSSGQNVRTRQLIVKFSIKVLLLCSLHALWLRYCRWSFWSWKLLIKSSWIWGLYGEGYKVRKETNKEDLAGNIKVRTTLITVTMWCQSQRTRRRQQGTQPWTSGEEISACSRMCLEEFHNTSCWKQKESKRDGWFSRVTSSMFKNGLSQWTVNQMQPEVLMNKELLTEFK